MNPELEQDFDAAVDFRMTLNPETDRGCALMAAAYLDSRLAGCLTRYFIEDSRIVASMLGRDRPLSSFSSRIDMAYLLGLITPNEKTALHLIRKIRNEFGHDPKPLEFDDQPIAERCKVLDDLGFYKRGKHRAMFTGTVMMVLAGLNVRLRATTHRESLANLDLKDATAAHLNLRVANALVVFATATAQEKNHAVSELEAACEALLGGKDQKELAQKLVVHMISRLAKVPD